jgi:hypothetical protein
MQSYVRLYNQSVKSVHRAHKVSKMGDGGKGSKARPFSVSQEEFANSFELIFGKKDKMQVRVKENAEEFGKCGCGRSPTGKCIGGHGLNEEQLKEAQEKYQASVNEAK